MFSPSARRPDTGHMTFAALTQLCKDFSLASFQDASDANSFCRLGCGSDVQAPHLISLHQLRMIYELASPDEFRTLDAPVRQLCDRCMRSAECLDTTTGAPARHQATSKCRGSFSGFAFQDRVLGCCSQMPDDSDSD